MTEPAARADKVDDTPNQGPELRHTYFSYVTCSNGPNGDMFMNYMDYVDDPACSCSRRPSRPHASLSRRPTRFVGPGGRRCGQSSGPVVAWGANRLDAFVMGTDWALYHKWWDGANWGPAVTDYEYMGGVCTSAPEAVAWGPNRLDVFVIGTDSALYHKWWDGGVGAVVNGYEYMGGVCVGDPRMVAWGPNRLDVFVLGTDRALYHKWWDGAPGGRRSTGTSTWAASATSPPEVVAWGPNRLDVFVLGTDRALYHKWWDGCVGTLGRRLGIPGGRLQSPARWWRGGPTGWTSLSRHGWRLYHKWWDGRTGDHRRRAASTWAASARSTRSGGVGPQPAWTSLCSAPTARCTTSGGTARPGDRRSTDYEYMGGICTRSPRGDGVGAQPARRVCHRHRLRALPQVVGWQAGGHRSPTTSTWVGLYPCFEQG